SVQGVSHDYYYVSPLRNTLGDYLKCDYDPKNWGGKEYCIMSKADAIAHCNSNPSCGGYQESSRPGWHDKWDRQGKRAVVLFQTGSASGVSGEWEGFVKVNVPKQATHNQNRGRAICT
ncbi:unnamed protein product, partial [Rotaria socialis]